MLPEVNEMVMMMIIAPTNTRPVFFTETTGGAYSAA